MSQCAWIKCDRLWSRMAIPLDKELVHALVKQRFGSIDALVVEWEERVASGTQKTGRARDRASIYRWLQRGLPSSRDDVLGLCGVLDVDPIGILGIDGSYVAKHFAQERWLFQRGSEKRSLLAPFWPIYMPGPAWPNDEVAMNFYGRSWFVRDFAHEPTRVANVYAAVHLLSVDRDMPLVPKTYHFAYRRTGARDGMWRPYGTVIGYRRQICLISESGDFQRVSDERSNEIVVTETYFGAGPAEFRVASLHDFDIRVDAPSQMKAPVRFVA